MIEALTFDLTLSREQYKSLLEIKDWEGRHWSSPPNNDIKAIKAELRRQLNDVQTKCAYCGIIFKTDGDKQIEHIAAKADQRPRRHPEFTFTLKNLVLSCTSCNSPSNKGTKETINNKHTLYSRCEFSIVHPYFDNPYDHFDWVNNNTQILIKEKNNSSKGKESIKMFDLNSSGMTELRAGQYRIEQSRRLHTLPQRLRNMLNAALGR